jgi:20S proteasome alpha/beta subunit
MRVLSLLALFTVATVGVPAIASATTIVGIWTENQITIAADSKQTRSQNGRIVDSQNACKIYGVRGLIFALAGLAEAGQVSVVEELRNSRELKEEGTNVKLPIDSLVVAAIQSVVKVMHTYSIDNVPNDAIQSSLLAR